MGDEMKKVRSGDRLRIPAGTYNRFIDAARVQRETGTLFRPGAGGVALSGGVALAYNSSGEDCHARAIVELRSLENTQAQIEFVASGDESGCGVYAITLDPIPADRFGRIAVSGGPWELAVGGAPIAAGQQISPAGSAKPQWEALQHSVDGIVVVRFLGGSNASLMIRATQAMVSDDVLYNCRFLSADGDLGAYLQCKRPVGIQVAEGSVGFLASDPEGSNVFIPANMRENASMPLFVEVRTGDPVTAYVGRMWYRSDLG